jgi:hypothetical protein
MNRLCLGSAKPTTQAVVSTRRSRRKLSLGDTMANRNYFNALAGLKLEDSPVSSPTAAAAQSG